MAVLQSGSDGSASRSNVFGHGVDFIDFGTLGSKSTSDLVDKHSSSETSSSDKSTLLPTDGYIVADLLCAVSRDRRGEEVSIRARKAP